MIRKKRELQTDLPPRSDPNYMRLYKEKNGNRLKQHGKDRYLGKKEQNPNFWKESYDPIRAKEYYSKNIKVLRERAWQKYGILNMTWGRYAEQLSKQDGKCDICHKIMNSPQTDHNHSTGEFRGLLCVACNNGLGIYERNKTKFEQYLTTKENVS